MNLPPLGTGVGQMNKQNSELCCEEDSSVGTIHMEEKSDLYVQLGNGG